MQILLLALLGGLVALVLGFLLYRLRQRSQRPPSNLVHRPHIDAEGNLMCFALGRRPPAPPIHTDKP
jgi:hypothetical protein